MTSRPCPLCGKPFEIGTYCLDGGLVHSAGLAAVIFLSAVAGQTTDDGGREDCDEHQ